MGIGRQGEGTRNAGTKFPTDRDTDPIQAGVVMSWVVGGKQGRQQFVKRLFRFRFGPQWYLIALVIPPALGILSAAVMLGTAPLGPLLSQAGGSIVTYLLSAVIFAV